MKRLIVCLDGTWKRPETPDGEQRASNVLRFMRALSPSAEGVNQVVFYDRGVGSDNLCDKYVGGLFGSGLSENVEDAYRWVANNFEPGDELHFFGFSRGAYTARSLGGLIGAIGVMGRGEIGALPQSYDYYRTACCPQADGEHAADCGRAAHPCHAAATAREKPPIACIGVWDTVGALGIPIGLLSAYNKRFQFHDVAIGRRVGAAFQALAIDEARKAFAPAIWEKPEGWAGRLEQCWFAGVHSDIGGGYPDSRLADLSLLWMVEKTRSIGLGFDEDVLRACLDPREPRHRGDMGDELKGLYRLAGRQARAVGEDPARGLTIHRSALERRDDAELSPRYPLAYP